MNKSQLSRIWTLSPTNPQALHGPRDIELVHGVHNDGGRGEEEEQQEEEDVEEDAAKPPTRAANRQVFPDERRYLAPQLTVIQQDRQNI